jgi:hypothetical protein
MCVFGLTDLSREGYKLEFYSIVVKRLFGKA